jgi:hypothetical protein
MRLGPLYRIAVMLMLCLAFIAARANGADSATVSSIEHTAGNMFCNGVRLVDEIVVVDTRSACTSCDPESLRSGIRVENYEVQDDAGHRRWRKSDLDNFLGFDPTVPTVFYVHGNQMTLGDAKSQGLAVYRKLVHYASGGPRIRFVIFSWPSAKVGRLLRDVRVKAQRTGPVGCQLAWLLDQMPAETPVSLIGFSFGARVITAGLHVLGGGTVCHGMGLTERMHPDRAPVNAVLIAAAVHAHWLGKGQNHGQATTQVNQVFLLNNCNDFALRYYHLSTTDRSRPRALGLYGPTRLDSEYAAKIHERDVSRYAGSEHDLMQYLCAPGAVGQVWEHSVSMLPAVASEPQAAN